LDNLIYPIVDAATKREALLANAAFNCKFAGVCLLNHVKNKKQ